MAKEKGGDARQTPAGGGGAGGRGRTGSPATRAGIRTRPSSGDRSRDVVTTRAPRTPRRRRTPPQFG